MHRALHKLDRSAFKNKFDECEIHVRLPKDSRFKAPAGSDGACLGCFRVCLYR
jgi:hypothetical protein